MAKFTPMIEQYLSVKAQVPDAFLFFRLGDFYELFFEDAIKAAKELEITLTGRDGGAEERIPMCGVPYHSAESYIAKLIEKGYKVAICEQMEDPATAKGMVRREIVRIVTPGTLMEGKMLGEADNNYIASAVADQSGYGFAVCDITTGELHVTSLDEEGQLMDELSVFNPAELLADEPLLVRVKAKLPPNGPSPLCTRYEPADIGILEDQFEPGATDGLDGLAKAAVARLIAYLRETQKRSLHHITRILSYRTGQFMTMDPFTRRNLELTETVRDRSRKGSLLWLLDRTVTSMGGRLLKRWLEKPLLDRQAIEARLEAVECLYNRLMDREELRDALKQIYDLERLVGRISYGNANARDLNALAASLRQIPAFRKICLDLGSKTLRRLVEQLDECGDIREWIETAIVDDPPVSVRDGGIIREGYHAHLDELRRANRDGKQWIAELEQKERERTGIKSLKIGFNKVFGYYIEVTKANLASLPEDLYERKQTLANAERFVTPELKEKEALILEAEEKMVDIEYELFTELRNRIAAEIPRLQRLAEVVAEADVYQSLASVSASNRFVKPVLTDGYDMRIQGGRHPVVEAVLADGSFIANDTVMTKQSGSTMLITGPNMAGKSTYLRQVAILTIMAQIGCFVPADRAEIPIVDRIFTRIGAADDLIGGQSTFMVEMMDIQVMTAKATRNSLVIIDELGRGTSTSEGMAIAQAVIEYMHNRIGCKTLVSTHFHELSHLEEALPGLLNYRMDVKESGEEVTFLRKLVRGAASTSYGIYCAQIAGLPKEIISRAYQLLKTFDEKQAAREAAAAAQAELEPVQEQGQISAGQTLAEKPVQAGWFQAEERPLAGQAFAEEQLPVVQQLSLFGDEPVAGKPQGSKVDERSMKVLGEIKAVDLINMTPLQAMNLIYEWKMKLTGK